MKPFDVERAKAGAQVVTRSGGAVRILCFDRVGTLLGRGNVVALVTERDGHEMMAVYDNDGYFMPGKSKAPCDHDLFMAPVKKQGWVNLYRFASDAVVYTDQTAVYLTEEEAKMRTKHKPAGSEYITTLRIEWEE